MLGHTLEQQLQAIDPTVGVGNVRTMEQVRSAAVAMRRFNMMLLSIFAALALVLATIGIYGVIAYNVTQRTHEIGLRMALGAQHADVLRMVLRQAVVLTALGVGVGIAGALTLTRVLESFLYRVEPTDPIAFVATALLLGTVAMLASYIPASRATRSIRWLHCGTNKICCSRPSDSSSLHYAPPCGVTPVGMTSLVFHRCSLHAGTVLTNGEADHEVCRSPMFCMRAWASTGARTLLSLSKYT